MTRNELLLNLRSLSAGTIGNAIGSDRYSVIDRAKHCLQELVESNGTAPAAVPVVIGEDPLSQISFADMQADEIREILIQTDLNTLTPLEAMNLLDRLKRKAMQ